MTDEVKIKSKTENPSTEPNKNQGNNETPPNGDSQDNKNNPVPSDQSSISTTPLKKETSKQATASNSGFVNIGCRFHNGIRLEVDGKTVILKGDRDHKIGFTKVRRDFWEAWKQVHAKSELLTSGGIFESTNDVR